MKFLKKHLCLFLKLSNMENFGLYIHIPFCKSKCSYCDFSSFANAESKMEDYIEALCHEIEIRAKDKSFDTVYVGGGTPSLLTDNLIEKLLKKIDGLNLTKDCEITFEMNPESVTKKKAQLLYNNKVNRISVGLQSTKDEILKEIGRIHNFLTFVKAYRVLREVGFKNINVDLMFGLPNQTLKDLEKTLDIVINLKPEHISSYSLILEEGTPMIQMVEKGLIKLPSEDTVVEMMSLVKERLKKNKYNRYEISNYSIKGFESKHNMKYWEFKDYVACGSSASGFIDGIRYVNVESIDEYIERIKNKKTVKKIRYKNKLEDSIEEFIFMGLRTSKGVDILEYKKRFNESIYDRFSDIIDKYEVSNHLKVINGRMILTESGVDASNYIMSDFIIDKE